MVLALEGLHEADILKIVGHLEKHLTEVLWGFEVLEHFADGLDGVEVLGFVGLVFVDDHLIGLEDGERPADLGDVEVGKLLRLALLDDGVRDADAEVEVVRLLKQSDSRLELRLLRKFLRSRSDLRLGALLGAGLIGFGFRRL